MEEIVKSVKNVTTIMSDIAIASDEQSNGISQVNIAVNQMDQATQQNAALVQQVSSAAQGMVEQTVMLRDAIAIFRLAKQY